MRSSSPHRVSALITSCFKTPVNLQSRAPTTLYERGEAVVRGMAVCLKPAEQNENDIDPEEQGYFLDCEDSIISSNLCGKSNEDYYKKIEKLKNAHVHAMAKLEKLYKSKFHIRDETFASEDPCETPVCYSSTCKLSSDKKNEVHLSYSTTEVNSTASLSLSELSNEDQEMVTSHERDLIQGMWDGFSVEMYTLRENPQKLISSNLPKVKIIKKEQKYWSPKITMPEPFQMTLREAEKKQQKIRSRSEIEIENYLQRKQLEEETECRKIFRANPVPAHTFIPLVEEIMERNEERRKFVKAKNKEILLAMQKPFAFLEREEKKKEIRNMQIIDLDFLVKKTKTFKANPVPKYLRDQKIIDRIEEEELYRAIRMKVRAQEMLNSASLPKSMLRNAVLKRRKTPCCESDNELKFKPQINAKVPNFEMLPRKSETQLMKKKKSTTKCEAFQLRTSHVFSKKKVVGDTVANETQLKEIHWPCVSNRKQSKLPSRIKTSPLGSLDLEIIRSTESSKKKETVRNHQRKRSKNYLLELEEKQESVNRKPLLLEMLAQRNAVRTAERCTPARKEQGLNEDLVSWQGHSVLHSSDRESVRNDDDSSGNEESFQEEADGLDFDFQEDIEDEESRDREENEDRV